MLARRWPWLAVGGAAGVGVVLLRTFDPNVADNPFPRCIFHAVTGLWCPGCGGTRALHALVHFDLAGALAMNSLLIVGGPIGLLLVLRALDQLPERWAQALQPLAKPWPWAFLVLGFWIARNLPWAPFSWLAPGGAG